MSVQAMSWAIAQRIVTDPPARHVLLCLANYAGADGAAAFPSVARLVEDTGLSERTVRAKLDLLLEQGAIRPGNRAIVAAYIERADRRPMCFDLCMERGAAPAPCAERGAAGASNGVQLVPERGAGAAPKPSVNHPSEPNTPLPPNPEDEAFERAWAAYPRRAGGNSKALARKAWDARRKQGHSADDLHAGTVRYAAYIRATNREGTEYVKQAASFFGPGLHFLEPWSPPRPVAGMHTSVDTGARPTTEIVDEAQQLGFRTLEAP